MDVYNLSRSSVHSPGIRRSCIWDAAVQVGFSVDERRSAFNVGWRLTVHI